MRVTGKRVESVESPVVCDTRHGRPRAGGARRRARAWAALGALLLTAAPPAAAQAAAAQARAQVAGADSALVLDGVTVIDVTDGQRRAAQRVVIVGNRIRTVEQERPGQAA